MTDYSIITDTEGLSQACEELNKSKFITIDTEFVRVSTYFPILCLVQIAGDDAVFIIDPIGNDIDFSSMFALFKNQDIIKIFHSCGQDIEIIYNMAEFIPSPLFDTQIAAMVCGFGESISYAKLAKHYTGVSLDKTGRFTDWSIRPLSKKQLDYAASDVTYLRTVYEKMDEYIQEQDRYGWIEEEMESLYDIRKYRTSPDQAWRRIKSRNGNSHKFSIMVKCIAKWREETAMRNNVSRNLLLKDGALLEVAAVAPSDISELKKLRTISNRILKNDKLCRQLLVVIAEAKEIKHDEEIAIEAEKPTIDASQSKSLIDLLKVLLKMRSEENLIAEKLIANNRQLAKIVHAIVSDTELPSIPSLQGWRSDIFGADAIKLCRGELAITADNGAIKVISNDA
jgi:ribonuclease D